MGKIITSLLLFTFVATAYAAPGLRVRKTNDYHYRQSFQDSVGPEGRAVERIEERLSRIEKRLDRLEDEIDRIERHQHKERAHRDYRDGKSSVGISITSDGIRMKNIDEESPAPKAKSEAKEWLCSIETMGGTFRGVGATKAVAKNKALKECEKKNGKSIFCDASEVECEQ